MDICVVALGKIGLPLALQFVSQGHRVFGADINEELVALVNAGKEPFPGEAELDVRLVEAINSGMLTASTDVTSSVAQAEAVVVVVPLIVDDEAQPDFRAMDAATEAIGNGLKPGTLVSYETTLPVHTTRKRFAPRLAELSGLTLGEDLFVCFSPERVYSGRIFADLRRYPKIVGAIDDASTKKAIEFYEAVLTFDERDDLSRPNGVWDVGSAEASELVKLAETTYRDVNIALANEFAVYARSIGVNILSVIEASNSQPFSHIHQPGISVGGHCIPVYPRLYLSNDPVALIPAASRKVNDAMPSFFTGLLMGAIGGSVADKKILVLGLAYRGNVKESAFSGTFPLVSQLESLGAEVLVHDPLYTDEEIRSYGFTPAPLNTHVDAIVLHTDHDEFKDLKPADVSSISVFIDGRRATDPAVWRDAGITHLDILPEDN